MIVLRSLAFYIVFYGGTVLLLLVAPLILLAGERGVRAVAEGWAYLHRFSVEKLLGIEIVVEGAPIAEPALYAIRHETFFEALDAPVMFDLPVPFAKAELFRIPMWGRVGKAYGLVPVDRKRGAAALREMLAAARRYSAQGRPLILFPEGTRVPHGERRKLQSGFAGIYKLVGLPVVPVAVDSGLIYRSFLKPRGKITYRFGEIIPPGLPREEVEARVLDAINALNR